MNDIKKAIEEEAEKRQEWLFDGVWEEPTLAESKLQCIEDFKKGGNFGANLVLSKEPEILFNFFIWFRENGDKYVDRSIENMIETYLKERDNGQ